jgi:hypothetical protein
MMRQELVEKAARLLWELDDRTRSPAERKSLNARSKRVWEKLSPEEKEAAMQELDELIVHGPQV